MSRWASGSEVTKQAGKMILTDDNFGTLVHAVELGRGDLRQDRLLRPLPDVAADRAGLLFLAASVFNINDGVAMTPPMVLFLLFVATASVS